MNQTLFKTVVSFATLVLWLAPSLSQEAAPWVTRFTGKHVFGEGVGHDEGFTSLDWFLPLNQDAETEMYFGDFRGVVFDDAEFGGNLGLGYRWYASAQDRIYGVNAYWDFRNEESLLFNQAGIGVETLGRILDFRVNGYTPTVNDASQRLPFTFRGNHLLENEYHGLTGIDYEAAANLPDIGPFQAKVAGGGYFFDSNNTGSAEGLRARAELAFRDQVAVGVSAQSDRVFGSTVNVSVEFRHLVEHFDAYSRRSMYHKFRNEQGSGDGRTVLHRLADPVYRQQNIVLKRTESLVTDGGGTPLTFVHAVPGGAGDGSFEMPHGTIANAMLNPLAPTSVIYTPEGGTFNENVTLVPGTRLLSNGPGQFVSSSIGTVQLPFSGAGSDLSALPASIVGNVDVASNTEFSGFQVTGGVSGTGVTTVNVNNTAVNSAPADAISFAASDAVTVNRIAISMPTGRGILLNDTNATISNATITGAGDDGVQVDSAGTDRIVSLTSTTITNAGNEGIDVNVAGAGNLTFTSTTPSITAVNNAVDVAKTAAGDALISLSEMTLQSTAGAGLNADGSAGAGTLFISAFNNTTVTDAATGGLLFDTVTFDAIPTSPTIQQIASGTTTVGSSAIRVTGSGVSLTDVTGNWNTGTLTVFNQAGTGLFVDNSGLGTPIVLSSEAGSAVNTATGGAIRLDTVTSALLFDSITSVTSPGVGNEITSVSGTLTSGAATSTGSVGASVRYENIPLGSPLTTVFGNRMFDNIIETVGDTSGLIQN